VFENGPCIDPGVDQFDVGFALHVGVHCYRFALAILVWCSTMSASKQANVHVVLPPQPVPTTSPPTSPPPQPRTWSRAVVRRRCKAPLLPPRIKPQ
jgi:hypothetical protein